VVAPASLLENWERELALWCPRLRVVTYHGAHKEMVRNQLEKWRYDVSGAVPRVLALAGWRDLLGGLVSVHVHARPQLAAVCSFFMVLSSILRLEEAKFDVHSFKFCRASCAQLMAVF
jgi:hypothetical protein